MFATKKLHVSLRTLLFIRSSSPCISETPPRRYQVCVVKSEQRDADEKLPLTRLLPNSCSAQHIKGTREEGAEASPVQLASLTTVRII